MDYLYLYIPNKTITHTDGSGSTVFAYDSNSRISSKTQNITTTSGTFTKVVSYTYDNAGQLTKITYPSGMEINYAYTNGVITSVKRGTTNLLTAPKYKGFSTQPYGWTWGNSTLRTLTTNTSNRLTSLVDGTILNQTYTQDNVDNVTAATDSVTSANTFSATYTASEQLTNFTNSSITRNYLQDTKFNVERITPFNPTTSALYYNLTSNKINSLTYGATYKYPMFDNKGNMTNDGNGGLFTYDLANNMITATKINSGVYKYNSLNQRVEKAVTVSGTTTKTYYIYDLDGLLLGEYNAAGTAIAEHVYLNNIPVAVTKGANNYFVHTDYLNTPRAVSSSTAVVWRWNNTNAYGYNAANETISGVTFEYNPRFAGQYFDKETGLHYNYHRMYNPELARYMQPDPIGVNGGMNIYSYVENNPLNSNDPFGLLTEYYLFPYSKGGKTFGHAAVRVNGVVYSLYPELKEGQTYSFGTAWFSKGDFVNQSVSAFLASQAGKEVNVYTINLSNEQESQLVSYFEQQKKKGVTYNLVSVFGLEQCTSFSSRALNSVQSSLEIPTFKPGSAIDYLNSNLHNTIIKKIDKGIIKHEYKNLSLE